MCKCRTEWNVFDIWPGAVDTSMKIKIYCRHCSEELSTKQIFKITEV